MKTRTQEITVGAFVVMAFIGLFFLAMRVSGLVTMVGGQNTYQLTAHFDNIGSLSTRAKVSLSGVTIGKVRSIEIDKERLDAKVTLDINDDFKQISSDAYASITTAGILGEQFISIEPGAEEVYLKDGDVISQTQSAMVLEDLIRQFVMNKTSEAVSDAESAKPKKSEKNQETPAEEEEFGNFG